MKKQPPFELFFKEEKNNTGLIMAVLCDISLAILIFVLIFN